MIANRDDLSKPRIIDYCHIFPERRQALAFAEAIDDRQLQVCITFSQEREMWDTVVKKHMIPTHQDITDVEHLLSIQAELLGGEADGWGCFSVKNRTG